MRMLFHIENVNKLGTEHNRIVRYASVDNVIRYALPRMPAGQYMIHQLSEDRPYGDPIRSTPAYRRTS